MANLSGVGVAYVIGGFVIFWSGFRNNSIAVTLKGFLSGNVPQDVPMTAPSIGVADTSPGSGSSSSGNSASTPNNQGLVNPIGPGLKSARVDMGVDYTGAGPLYALGDGTITSVHNAGWPGGTFIGLKLGDGRYVYYAENIAPSVHVGQQVKAGQVVGLARGSYPYIEIGWAAPPGTGTTMAAHTGQDSAGLAHGDPGAYPTKYGVDMSDLIKSLGGPPGIISGQVQG